MSVNRALHPPQPDRLLLTRLETAKRLGVCTKTLDKLVKSEGLPAVRFPKSRLVMFDPEAIRQRITELQGATTNGHAPDSAAG